MARNGGFDARDVYLLDEFESADTRALVRQLGVLEFRYGPLKWLGNYDNRAAAGFLRELNAERSNQGITLHWSPLRDMEVPYAYALPNLKKLLGASQRQLFLKNSRVTDYLSNVKPDEVPLMKWGDYPAIEALAMAVMALRDDKDRARLYEPVPPGDREGEDYDPLSYGRI